jgi:Trk-type K+ transport system membrane component
MQYINREKDAIDILFHIDTKTDHYLIVSKFGNTLLLLFEILCYLIFIGIIVTLILVGNGEIKETVALDENLHGELILRIEEVIKFVFYLKIAIGLISSLLFIPAYLLRKLRKKNNDLEEIHSQTNNFLLHYKLKKTWLESKFNN